MWSSSLQRTPAPFLVAIADDARIIVKPAGATCYLEEAAGKESSKAAYKRQILWLAMRMTALG
jgi:hypothetical protein